METSSGSLLKIKIMDVNLGAYWTELGYKIYSRLNDKDSWKLVADVLDNYWEADKVMEEALLLLENKNTTMIILQEKTITTIVRVVE